MHVRTVITWCTDRPMTCTFAVCAAILVGWYLWSSYQLSGTVYATVIGTDGTVRSISFNAGSVDEVTYRTFKQDIRRAVISVVPAPHGEQAAFVTRSRGAPPELSIGTPDGDATKVVSVGDVSDPRWSPEGAGIAFSVRDETGDATTPEGWEVTRAVPQGDALAVGRGYGPHPSPGQRTYALTSRGIALLAYDDVAPTLVVASPVPVPLSTPFTVSQDGTRLAWVAPADRSLQVFENAGGYFVPLALEKEFIPETMTFSPDGRALLGTTHTEATTTVTLFTISTQRVRTLGTLSGFLRLHAWTNE